jgi:LmbE family N-acetylglucosaminyl deacetylase
LDILKGYFCRFKQQALRMTGVCLGSGEMSLPGRLVVIAPHPDDEIFGCGGLIAHAKARQAQIHIILLTGGENAHENCCEVKEEDLSDKRRTLAMSAGAVLGLSSEAFTFMGWPDGNLEESILRDSEKLMQLAGVIESFSPDAIFCPHPFEGWSDHVAAQGITRAAIKCSKVKTTIYYYCVWFWHSMSLIKAFQCDWKNAFTLDIRDVYDQKQRAISEYMNPLAPCGNPWSGKLPNEFLKAFQWKKELFFKSKLE